MELDIIMMSYIRGFTLIEMMIVIAVIGIIAAIAIPKYQNYIVKAQAGRIIHETGELRLSVEDCLNEGKTQVGLGIYECDPRASASNIIQGNSQVGVVLPNNTGVAQLTNPLTATSTITAVLSNSVAPPLKAKKLVWQRQSNGSWFCLSNIDESYLPTTCIYQDM